ncbi:adenylyl-sulfate kinase [Cesiribacter sp. SM1]|uniref:adenylyl-sulfate kinase n=1 Tax=Cesiribacter sp. SM1 TaxID=2861196 RepID=UPI001CD455FC
MENIHPIFDRILDRSQKERLLKQRAAVIWMVGLSGSGKSTIAQALEKRLHQDGCLTQLLDGDNLRSGLNSNLGFSEEDRRENLRRSAETAKLFLNCGIITICSFISPTAEVRERAKSIIGEADFLEVHVKCSFDACAKRDVKGLYAKALRGEIKNFTGLDAPFEEPQNPWLQLNSEEESEEACVELLYTKLIQRVKTQQD